jgi:ADP-ribose pyrophosphatase YjhB (NUDIX family)
MALHKTLLDACGPLAWRLAHQLRLLWWRVRRPVNLGVGAIVLNNQGEVLLVRHSYLPDWMIPGGAVDWGETAVNAAIREVQEECRLEISALELCTVRMVKAAGACNHVLIFKAAANGTPRCEGSEITDLGWFPVNKLPADTQPRSRELIGLYGVSPMSRPENKTANA